MVVPTVYGFDTDNLYVHGSAASRSLTGREPSRSRNGSESPDAGADAVTDARQDTPGGSGAETGAAMDTVCVTVTHVDGLVLARSVFEHGVNYRSAMVYGVPRKLEGEEKLTALRILTEHSAPGQWDYPGSQPQGAGGDDHSRDLPGGGVRQDELGPARRRRGARRRAGALGGRAADRHHLAGPDSRSPAP